MCFSRNVSMHCQNDSCWNAINCPSRASLFQGLFFKLSPIVLYVVENFRLKYEECSVDPPSDACGFPRNGRSYSRQDRDGHNGLAAAPR